MTIQEKMAKVADLRPIDDVFFEVLAADKLFCREMLRTILQKPGLELTSVEVQSSERNIYGRSVRLDALCSLSDGSKANVEVQRADNDNHLKRARFHAASITVINSETGTRFEDLPDVYIVYISEFDFLKGGRTIYHVEKVIRETGEVIDDGLHEIFVNTEVDDGTDISELMKCFMMKQVDNPKFPALSEAVNRIKTTEEGLNTMCEVMKRYEDIARAEGEAKGEAKGRAEGRAEGQNLVVQKMLLAGLPQEQIDTILSLQVQ